MTARLPWVGAAAALSVLVGTVVAPAASATSTCNLTAPAGGGEWLTYGQSSSNTRSQPDEHSIGVATAADLTPAWSFYTGHPSGGAALGLSELSGTPIVAGSCVYIGTTFARTDSATTGDNVFALDASTGKVVWSQYVDADLTGVGGSMGAVVGTPAVTRNLLLVPVNQSGDGHAKGPYVVAFDRRDGKRVWTSGALVTTLADYTNSSIALGPRDVAMLGFSAKEGAETSHGGIALLDTRTGRRLGSPAYSIPESDWYEKDGTTPRYGGGGVWSTPAVDLSAGYAYYGTGNPFSKKMAHPRTNAILKLDVDRTRPTFGRIVASYAGNIDQYMAGAGTALQTATQSTTCKYAPDNPAADLPDVDSRQALLQSDLSNSPGCGQLDLDFGGSAQLFTDASGRQLVGELQKSGVYHAVPTGTMTDFTRALDGTAQPATTKAAWQSELGHSCQACNGSSTAFDPARGRVFAAVAPGSVLAAVDATPVSDATSRSWAWLAPVGDITHYSPVSTANGVVYLSDNWGYLNAFDAATGALLLHRSLMADLLQNGSQGDDGGSDAMGLCGAGIAIAQHTVFVATGSHLVAYRTAA